MSTMNTRTLVEQEAVIGAVPDPYPSSVNPLKNVFFPDDTSATAMFDAFLNCVQRHKCDQRGTARRQ